MYSSADLLINFSNLLGAEIVSIEKVSGGGNSQVLRLLDSNLWCGKCYDNETGRNWDRLSTEWNASEYMWSMDLRCIPRPIGIDPENRIAIYEWIEPDSKELNDERFIQEAFEFIADLDTISKLRNPITIKDASDAIFSLKIYIRFYLGGLRD